MAKAIQVENLSKQYRLGQIGTGSLVHDVNRWWHSVRGKENPYLKIGEANDRTTKGASDYVWSLRDVGFDIEQGDSVGIIGRNGAGKSTLLKILSRVTAPTTGSVKVKGRIASLLEVGTGFHPDLSGRDNIFLNGAILGMRKGEIARKFDEIVDFAGVERYIDTPVKRYSSGMYVRLAFAVAAYLESEILIVDEVLAVGDAEFQKKCLGKMGDVSKGEGRTVLFVSHNMAAVKQLCNKGILLNNGTVIYDGLIKNVINEYLKSNSGKRTYTKEDDKDKVIQILELTSSKSEYTYEEDIYIFVTIKNDSSEGAARCNIAFYDVLDQLLFIEMLSLQPYTNVQTYKLRVPGGKFAPIKLRVNATIDIPHVKAIEIMEEFISVEIINVGVNIAKYGDSNIGLLLSNGEWEKLNNKLHHD